MEQMYVTIENGKAVTHKAEVEGCLTTQAKVLKAIVGMTGAEISEFYKSLTGQVVERFASKDDAAKRIAKFINPTGMVKRDKPKTPVVSRTGTVNKMLGKKEKKQSLSKIVDQTISIIPHDKKTFQKGSVRETCYDIIMKNASDNKLSVEAYLKKSTSAGIEESNALACLKKLCQPNQKVQTMELV